MTGEQRVRELRQHGVLVADDAVDERFARSASARTAFARISSLTGRDSQPLARRSPRVAGRLMRASCMSRRSRCRLACPPITLPAVDLYGTRGARIAGDGRPREAVRGPGFDDGELEHVAFPTIGAPSRRSRTSDGPLLYRRTLRRTRHRRPDRRSFLEFDGIFYYGDVVARRRLPRRHRGLLRPARVRGHRCAPTAATSTCSRSRSRARRSATAPRSAPITGLFWHWDAARSRRSTRAASGGRCGSSRPGPVRIATLRVAVHRSVDRARPPRLRTSRSTRATARSTPSARDVRGADGHDAARRVPRDHARGRRRTSCRGRSTVDDPPRWWPRSLGAAAAVHRSSSRSRSTTSRATNATVRTAFREVRRRRLEVLGQRRTHLPQGREPTRRRAWLLGDADVDELVRDRRARAMDANLDFLRVHAHVAPAGALRRRRRARPAPVAGPPDAVGLRTRRTQARRPARRARWSTCSVTTRACSLWCAHDAPLGDEPGAVARRVLSSPQRGRCRRGARKCSTARSRRRIAARRTRPVVRTAACCPASPAPATTRTCGSAGATAISPGSRRASARCPRLGRFVSEFGAQSVPETARVDAARTLARPRLGRRSPRHHGMERDAFDAARAARRREVVRRVARRDAGVPSRAPAAPDRGPAPAARARRPAASPCSRSPTRRPRSSCRCSTTNASRSAAYCAVRDACRPCCRWSTRAPARPRRQRHPRRSDRRARSRSSVDGRVTRWTGDIAADGIVFVGRVELGDAVDVEAVLDASRHRPSRQPLPAPRPRSGPRRGGCRCHDASRFGVRPVTPSVESDSRSHERPETHNEEASRRWQRRRHRPAVRPGRCGRSAARRSGARPLLPIGGRQEVGHGDHRHHPHGASCSRT